MFQRSLSGLPKQGNWERGEGEKLFSFLPSLNIPLPPSPLLSKSSIIKLVSAQLVVRSFVQTFMAKNWPGSLHPRELECHVFFSRLLQIQSTLRIVPGKEIKEYNCIVFIKHQSLNLLDRNTSWFFIRYAYDIQHRCDERTVMSTTEARLGTRQRWTHTPAGDIRRPTVNDLLHCRNLQEQNMH